MKALVQYGIGRRARAVVEDVAAPVLKRGQVQIRVEAAGINGSDWEGFTGTPFYARPAYWFAKKPRVIGTDVVGIVETVGAGVDLAPGTRVLGDVMMGGTGTCAEICVADAGRLVPVSAEFGSKLSIDVLASLPQSGGIVLFAFEDRITPGMRVLINGAGGGTGPMAIRFAKAAGAHVTAVDTGGKAAQMQAAGADEILDFGQVDFCALGREWDYILDLFGTRSAKRVTRAVAPGGCYRMVGGHVPKMLSILVGRGRARRQNKDVGVLAVEMPPARLHDMMKLAADGVLDPIVAQSVPLADAAAAFTAHGKGRQVPAGGKLVIRP